MIVSRQTAPLDSASCSDGDSHDGRHREHSTKQPLQDDDDAESELTFRGSYSSCCPTRKMVRFDDPETSLVVPPPTEPMTPTEKRSVWYSGKELKIMEQADLLNYEEYLAKHRSKRHSYLPTGWHSHGSSNALSDLARRSSAPESNSNNNNSNSNSPCWRGLENHKARKEHAHKVVQEIVACHKQLQATGLPPLNEELRKACKERTRSDRLKAEQVGLQDAKAALGKIEVVMDLITHRHTTRNNAARQIRKVGVLAKMGVSGAIGAISV